MKKTILLTLASMVALSGCSSVGDDKEIAKSESLFNVYKVSLPDDRFYNIHVAKTEPTKKVFNVDGFKQVEIDNVTNEFGFEFNEVARSYPVTLVNPKTGKDVDFKYSINGFSSDEKMILHFESMGSCSLMVESTLNFADGCGVKIERVQ